MATFSNLGIKLITTGNETTTWGNSTNNNFELFDTAIVGYIQLTLAAVYTSGSPYALQLLDNTVSDARNRLIEFTSAADLGANIYVQITPSDFEGYWFIRNSLAGSRSLFVFQGTYDAGRTLEIPPGRDMLVRCSGTGDISTVYNQFRNLQVDSITTNSINVVTAATGNLNMGGFKISNLGTPTAGTDAATKAYVDAAGSIVYVSGNQILFRASAAGTGAIPAGWTIAAQNDKALRIVSGTPSSNVSGVNFSSAFNVAVTSTLSGDHTHTYSATTNTVASGPTAASGGAAFTVATNGHNHTISGTTSGVSTTHNHNTTIPNILYYDFNVIQKS